MLFYGNPGQCTKASVTLDTRSIYQSVECTAVWSIWVSKDLFERNKYKNHTEYGRAAAVSGTSNAIAVREGYGADTSAMLLVPLPSIEP